MKRPQPNTLLDFVRLSPRKKPRDWTTRWFLAGNSIKWEGAEKDHMRAYAWSPIWGVLAQGWRDSIPQETDDVQPPFAYGSGMGWRDEKGNEYFEGEGEGEDEDEDEVTDTQLMELLPYIGLSEMTIRM